MADYSKRSSSTVQRSSLRPDFDGFKREILQFASDEANYSGAALYSAHAEGVASALEVRLG